MRVRRSAFTLIELLAVIAIIAAIAAIAFPVIARVRESRNQTVCISNLRQLGLALKMYRDDWDGHEARYGVKLSHSDLGLPYELPPIYPYIRNRDVLFCPSDTRDLKYWATSYWTNFCASELMAPEIDWERLAALRGPDYGLAVCTFHNGPEYPAQARFSWETMMHLVLRIDGRVTRRYFPAHHPPDHYSW